MADATIVGYRPEAMDHVAAFLAGNSKSLPERVLHPVSDETKRQTEKCARRFLQCLDHPRAEVLLRLIDRAGQVHRRPKVPRLLIRKHFLGAWQPLQISPRNPYADLAAY